MAKTQGSPPESFIVQKMPSCLMLRASPELSLIRVSASVTTVSQRK